MGGNGTVHLQNFGGKGVGQLKTVYILEVQVLTQDESCEGSITSTGTIPDFNIRGMQGEGFIFFVKSGLHFSIMQPDIMYPVVQQFFDLHLCHGGLFRTENR